MAMEIYASIMMILLCIQTLRLHGEQQRHQDLRDELQRMIDDLQEMKEKGAN
ncbi:hypothetical protein [Bacillus paranthracis]|uniref:hypothetical protein n=1 Tax=Bacillus paranthracis TaxID=2026186 RepID=UPI003D656145